MNEGMMLAAIFENVSTRRDELYSNLQKIQFDPYEDYSASYIVSQVDEAMCYNERWNGN